MTWQFKYAPSATLPPLFWLAKVRGNVVDVRCGLAVRTSDEGFFEGTWSGAAKLTGVLEAHTVFGTGVFTKGDDLIVITPSHMLEAVHHARDGEGALYVSNSLVALLVATGRELRDDVRYPPILGVTNRGLAGSTIEVPTTTQPITMQYFFNLVVNASGDLALRDKPEYEEFANYQAYRDFLVEHTRSAFANASDYEPVVAMSSGYDSTACAAVAAQAGCRLVVNFRTGWPWKGYKGDVDSPDVAARALGMAVERYERLAYMECDDAPEAEFVSTGGTGEDVVYRSMDTALARRIVVTGYWGGAAWRGHGREGLRRIDLSGSSMAEFRKRIGMIHVPLPYIGGLHQPRMAAIRNSAEMKPFSVGGEYDEPVARRMAEEAGVPRDSFGRQKLAASQLMHRKGISAMSPSGRASFEGFAGKAALANLPSRAAIGRRHRGLIKAAAALHLDPLTAGMRERVRQSVNYEPVLGSLLFRWGVDTTRPRYAEIGILSDR